MVCIMLFSKQLSAANLIELCRALHHNLAAGLRLLDVFRQQSKRGPAAVRPVAERIAAQLGKGKSLETALKGEKTAFPPIFIDLALVAENTGHLAEIFGELEEYFRLQLKLGRQFLSQIMLPVIQFFLAIFIVAGLIFTLGAIAEARGARAPEPIGLGFRGTAGAIWFLIWCFGLLTGLVILYLFLTRSLKSMAFIEELILKVPLIGPCRQAFALGRFTLALRLTLDSDMSVLEALRLSLRATSNAAFVARTSVILDALRSGDDLAMALGASHIFPEDFVNIMAVAEESGRIPEVMRQQAKYYQDEASRRLTALTRGTAFLFYIGYIVFMVILIFHLAGSYLGALKVG
jgi:type II secretory pathway component PulF